jgi:hypothetical protein
VLFIGGFAVSVVNGMLYKIVPFLAWFHLQAQLQAKAGSIPTMKDMIAERWMRWQFRLHLAACALLGCATGGRACSPCRGGARPDCRPCCCGSTWWRPRVAMFAMAGVFVIPRHAGEANDQAAS